MENDSQRKRIVLGVMLIAVVVVTLASTFAYFVSNTQSEPEKLTVQTGTLALTFSDNNTGITASSLSLGQSTTKEFKIENTGTLDVTTNMLWNNLVNTYTEGSLTYTFEYSTNETGPWTAVPNASGNIPQSESASDKTLAPDITIPAHTTYYYQLTITLNHLANVDQTADKDAVLSSNFKLGDKILEYGAEVTLAKLNVTPKTGSPDFGAPATTDEGVYSLPDDYGTSYYYRGAVTNNYVKFGKWADGTTLADGTDASGKDMYWRIIRVNGDGSLRMIYDGTKAYTNGISSADRLTHKGKVYNAYHNDAKYVGWMFGGVNGEASVSKTAAQKNETNSNLKNLVNTWYDQNLTSYDQYIADAVYCNDRSIPGRSVTGWLDDTGLGYAKYATGYGARALVYGDADHRNKLTTFACLQKNDAFTVSDSTYGNAIGTAKSRKIGLITIPEIMAAGGSRNNNKNYYLYKGSCYWSITPTNMTGSSSFLAYVFVINVETIDNDFVSNNGYGRDVAPVISIKAEYAAQLTGSGTASSPFQIPGVA